MADGKRYAGHRKDLLPTFLVSKKTKWNGEKPHTQIETPPKFRPAVHPLPSFARLYETRISSILCEKVVRRRGFERRSSAIKADAIITTISVKSTEIVGEIVTAIYLLHH